MQRYISDLEARDLRRAGSGIRAQAMNRDGVLVDDFVIETSERSLHVLNAPSPAATASLAIGGIIAERAAEHLGLR
jgi:(S)-2-hydroxyglutarate dehydrogenase